MGTTTFNGSVGTWLKLSRVSNLPTVLTNSIVGLAIVNISSVPATILYLFAMIGFYSAGMILNDAFDAEYDRKHQSYRPIVRGEISKSTTMKGGIFLIILSYVFLLLFSLSLDTLSGFDFIAALILPSAIVLYDMWHKSNPISPLIMASCRALVYLTPGLLLLPQTTLSKLYFIAASVLFIYVACLTLVAKVGYGYLIKYLIAGICLIDAILLVVLGQPAFAVFAIIMLPITLMLQKLVSGT